MELCEVAKLPVDSHLRIEAALLRHVAELPLLLSPHRPSLPAHLAGVRLEHPERDAHGRRLAGTVRADEPDQLALLRLQREAV